MRTAFIILAAALCALPGCTAAQLSRNTVTQAHSHTDILYRQVLDNLAAAECNPDVLPHFSVIGTGGTLVIDSASANAGFDWDSRTFLGSTLGLGGSRGIEDGWTLAPVVNPDKLRAMRSAYQIVSRGEAADPVGFSLLNSYLGPDYMPLLQQGWYGVGSKHDVPKHACYVSHCGDRYVWVTGDGLAGLSQLSLAVLNIATLEESGAAPAPHNKEYLPSPDESDEYVPRARENYYNPLQSQIQMMGR